MMRLADRLLQWTGDVSFADYWERNLWNGILAQQHPKTGMVAYFLPLQPGSAKQWGSPTEDFWCCHGTMVEAHTVNERCLYFEDDDGLVVTQYFPSVLSWKRDGIAVEVGQASNPQLDAARRPNSLAFEFTVSCERSVQFALKLRIPWWIHGEPMISVNGERECGRFAPSSLHTLRRTWSHDRVSVSFPKALTGDPLPDNHAMVAFMDGPVVLAGLCPGQPLLHGIRGNPEGILAPHNEREWGEWEPGYTTVNEEHNIRFVPLHRIADEQYTVYFPLHDAT
jgi:DUF1680 family protein